MSAAGSAVIAAVFGGHAGGGPQIQPAAAAVTKEYVALGDSYASGVGTLAYDSTSGDCKRSQLGYPALWAKSHPEYSLKNVACSGASIADVDASQLSTLSSNTDQVTITIGGNDIGFTSGVKNCLTSDLLCNVTAQLVTYYAQYRLGPQLEGLFSKIHDRAPNAKLYVLGYPHVVAPAGTCNLFSATSPRPNDMNQVVDAVDEALKSAALKTKATFIDVRQKFAGHEACGPNPWINSVNLMQLQETFHPTAEGYEKGYAMSNVVG